MYISYTSLQFERWTHVLHVHCTTQVSQPCIGLGSSTIKTDSKRFKEKGLNIQSIQTSLSPDAKEFKVSTANALMIMLFNLKYISETLRKLYGNVKHQFKLETCFLLSYHLQAMLYMYMYVHAMHTIFVFPLPVRIHFHCMPVKIQKLCTCACICFRDWSN